MLRIASELIVCFTFASWAVLGLCGELSLDLFFAAFETAMLDAFVHFRVEINRFTHVHPNTRLRPYHLLSNLVHHDKASIILISIWSIQVRHL